jgi:Protein of unknown function (DUF3383)
MSTNVIFPPSYIVNVTIEGTPSFLNAPNINTVALISSETPSWSPTDPYMVYTNASQVGIDFGTGSKAYAIATAFFAQNPNPLNSGGYLVIIPIITADGGLYQAAITRTLNQIYYFGILIDEDAHSIAGSSQFANLAAYVQTIDKMFITASLTPADFQSSGLLYNVQQAAQVNTRGIYYNDTVNVDTPAFAAAYASRGLSTNWSGSNTAQTMNLKQIANFLPDQSLTPTYLTQTQTAGVDVYPSFGGDPGLYTSGANGWFDQIYGQFWLKFAIQAAGYNFLAQTSTKIPQTEVGMTGLKGAYMTVLAQGVNNGFMAPGAWVGATPFGNSADLIRCIADKGYYIYSLPVAQQLTADRNARKAPLVQIAVKLAGAIQSSQVIVQVQQ